MARFVVAALACYAASASAQGFAATPDSNKVYLGMWSDLSAGYYQTPASSNALLGLNFPIFQIGQSIPIPAYDYSTGAGGEAPFQAAADTNTNAAYMLTVYPDQTGNLSAVQDSDLVQLANQIVVYQSQGRVVYLRFAPEMGGNWNSYGLQPTLFKSLWIRMYTIIKQIAPNTVVLWSPNTSYGYPSGATLDNVVSQEDKTALDTNNDGQLTAADDAFSPYYPGDAYVDWAGVSLYYKGPGFQNLNQPQPGGFCSNILAGIDPYYSANYTPFYDTYCGQPNRPCILSECGAAYHVNVTGGSTALEIQQAWWEDCLTNTTFYDQHPQIKAVMMFEHAKDEFDGGVQDFRDFRILNATDSRTAFQAAVQAIGDRLVWANSTLTGSDEVDTALATGTPILLSVSASTLVETVISSLSSETITYTSTGYSTPYLNPSGVALTNNGLSIADNAAATSGAIQAAANDNSGATTLASLSLVSCVALFLFALDFA